MSDRQDAARTTAIRLGVLLLVIGLVSAVDSLLQLSVVHKLWPLLVVALASGLLGIFVKSGRRAPVFLATGTYLLCFSVLALCCTLTSWALLAVLWPLFITFLGLVFLALFQFHSARRFNLLAGLLLVSLSAVLGVLVTLGAKYWWTAFVLAGLSTLAAEKAR